MALRGRGTPTAAVSGCVAHGGLDGAAGIAARTVATNSDGLLFAPTLTLLGMVSPVALRLLAKEVSDLGHTAGWVYGLSTLAGLAATLVTGLETLRLTRPAGRAALVIGLGTGEVATSLARHDVRSDVIEIDPQIVRFAKEYFAFVPTGDVFTEDARTFVRHTNRHYDFVIHDTFTGGKTPEHLLSVEVLERTFRDSAKRSHELSNIVSFASREAFDFAPPTPPFESRSCEHTLTHFLEWEVHGELDSHAPLITHANNPLARLSVPVSEAFSEALAARYPKEFWLQ